MAILSEFLGTIVSSVSNARMQADIQTTIIAEEYAKSELLQYFAVPRMRFKDVEIKIPVALQSINNAQPKQYEPIDGKAFLSITYNEILQTMGAKNLPLNLSNQIRSFLTKNIQLLESRLRIMDSEDALKEFTAKSVADLMTNIDSIYKTLKNRSLQGQEREAFQLKLTEGLQRILKDEIKIKSGTGEPASLNVIIEADKLREIKPENIFMITVKISEDGMEWQKIENRDGGITSKLIPE